jgi:uncharacterized phage protein (TIGR01671 family)
MSNRELKFRAWDNLKKEWLKRKVYHFNPHFNEEGIGEFRLSQHPEGFTIQQYTGLKDRNGNDIYEGDICNAGIVIGDVNYSIGGFYLASNPLMEYFKGYPDNMNVLSPDWDYSWIDVEVIGNVMQNPELLKTNE